MLNLNVIKMAVSKVNWVKVAGNTGTLLSLAGMLASNYSSKKSMESMIAKEVEKALHK